MIKYTLENYQEQLNHQVIHMDQGVCYNPEFKASKMMHDYPSRKAQLARAIFKGELELTKYGGTLIFQSIFSRLGERWQNFRENPEDCTDVMILSRKMLIDKGFDYLGTKDFLALLQKNQGKLFGDKAWDLPFDVQSNMAIILDEHTAHYAQNSMNTFKDYCLKKKLTFKNIAETEFLGFEYFAYGLVEKGTLQLSALIEKYNALSVKKVLTLSAQSTYMFTIFADKLGLKKNFEVEYLIDRIVPIITTAQDRIYVYGGSFNLRYLAKSNTLNRIVSTQDETPIPNCPEFTPIINGPGRVNKVTMWQKPLGGEYEVFGIKKELLQTIRANALKDIKVAKPTKIIVFEPTALPLLKGEASQVVYYLDILE